MKVRWSKNSIRKYEWLSHVFNQLKESYNVSKVDGLTWHKDTRQEDAKRVRPIS